MQRSHIPKISRRSFLRSSAGAALLGSSGMLTGCVSNRYAESQLGQVVVIGAGMAGISTALTLQEAGYGVVVLEASNRVGGRIRTDRSLGVPLELGAARLRGFKKNPVMPFVEAAGLEHVDFEWNNLHGVASDGTELDEEKLSKAKSDLIRLVARAVIRNLGRNKDATVAEIIEHEKSLRDLTVEEERILHFSLASAEIGNGSPFSETSWKYLRDFEAYGGEEQFVISGFDALPKSMAATLDIRFNQKVEAIDYSGDRVRVTTRDTTFSSEFVVVTVSLGVLQSNAVTFIPELPENKQVAIERMGMGNLSKVGLRFPKPFWPVDRHALVHGTDTFGEYPTFINMMRYTNEPVLLAMIPQSYRNALEDLPDKMIAREAHAVLQGMYGTNIPAPTGLVRSSWQNDPLFRGSFSYNKIGAEGADRDDLARSMANKVFFAGEATHRKKYGSVGGAYHSGERAAREILQATRLLQMT